MKISGSHNIETRTSRHNRVVLRSDVVRQVVVEDETKKTIEQSQIDLLVHLREDGLHHYIALSLARLPNVGQVVDTLTPFVDEKRGRLSVGRFDPGREETTLVRPKEREKLMTRVEEIKTKRRTRRTRIDPNTMNGG